MSNTPLPPPPSPPDPAFCLRRLALLLMDAADCYDEGQEQEGARAALDVAERVRQLVTSPTA